MDKSRMTFTFRGPEKESESTSYENRRQRTYRSYEYDRTRGSAYRRPVNTTPPKKWWESFVRGAWVMPALLASITGVALGLGVWYVFQNGTGDLKPSVTTVSTTDPSKSTNSTTQSFYGLQAVVYQIGSYSDQAGAKKGAAEFEKIGVHPVLRNAGQYQLLIGIATDKAHGQPVVDLLNKSQIHFYAKDYVIPEKKGIIQGISSKDATTLTSILTQSLLLAKGGIEVTTDPTKKDISSVWIGKVQGFTAQADMGRKILDKSGKSGELLRYNDMQQQLKDAASALASGNSLLQVQNHLLQAIVDYEELLSKLVP